MKTSGAPTYFLALFRFNFSTCECTEQKVTVTDNASAALLQLPVYRTAQGTYSDSFQAKLARGRI
jgi:hypothetical protein